MSKHFVHRIKTNMTPLTSVGQIVNHCHQKWLLNSFLNIQEEETLRRFCSQPVGSWLSLWGKKGPGLSEATTTLTLPARCCLIGPDQIRWRPVGARTKRRRPANHISFPTQHHRARLHSQPLRGGRAERGNKQETNWGLGISVRPWDNNTTTGNNNAGPADCWDFFSFYVLDANADKF